MVLRIILLVLVAGAVACGGPRPGDAGGEVMVFAAASLRDAMEELGGAFERETGVRVLFNFGGSNNLARQALATGRADLFLSADPDWVDTLERRGRVARGSRVDLLGNTLVLITARPDRAALRDACELARVPFDHLAMGDPDAVPAGRYALAWLTSVRCGDATLWSRVRDRVASAPDVRAVVGQTLADHDVVGIVYRTDWQAYRERTTLLLEVSDGPTIRYVLARLNTAPNADAAETFRRYLLGPAARAVFQRHGFIDVPHDTTSS